MKAGSGTGGPASTKTNKNQRVDPDDSPGAPAAASGGSASGLSSLSKGRWERPVASKKKPRPPKVITRENPNALRSHLLEIAGGADIVEAVVAFARRRQHGVVVLYASGSVRDATLRQPGASEDSIVTFKGTFQIFSLSGAVMPPPSLPGATGLVLYLGGGEGQVVGGKVVGHLVASGPVIVAAAIFSDITYERLPLVDDEPAEAAAAADPDESSTGVASECRSLDPESTPSHDLQPDMPKEEDNLSVEQTLKYTPRDMEIDTPGYGDAWLVQNLHDSGTPETSQKCTDDLKPSQTSILEQEERLVLQRTLFEMHDLIKFAEWWVHMDFFADFQNAKDAVYCAEDLLDELNYYELKEEIEGSTIRSVCLESSDVKMEEAKEKLDHLIRKMGHLSLHDARQQFIDESICQEANLFEEEQAIFGRQKELMELIGMLDFQENNPTSDQVIAATTVPDRDRARLENVSVLPIVGTGGVGKTTLAHQFFCEKRVGDHFDLLIWISVSDGFDEKKLIKKLIQSVAESEMKSDDLSYLQRILTDGIIHQSRKFLLVLDDAQDDICREECHPWNCFLAPLKRAKPGSTILVTTKSLRVAEHLGTINHFVLEGLPKGTLWNFFRMHALGSDNSDSNPVFLSIGRSIVSRLNGSPLDAKILGRLLSRKLDPLYWRNILESELWKLPHQVKERVLTHKQEENDNISSALKLSYQYLPFHLKRCFSFCSLYPRNYEFKVEILVECWVAVGLVLPYGGMLALDVGHVYFQQLMNRSFFQKAPLSSRYIMHDLVYAMAQQVSRNECFVIKDRYDLSRIPPSVRHLSVLGNSGVESSDLESLQTYRTLRSVVCISIDSDIITASVLETWFRDLVNIRMLRFISCQLKELPENVGNLVHLRYLDISACEFDKFPDSFWRLYKLESLDARNCKIQDVPKDIVKLVNLQRVRLNDDLMRQLGCVPRVGNLLFLQEMPYYAVGIEPGRTIAELKNMNDLRGILEISGLCGVTSMEQSGEAALDRKIYLNTLILSWGESTRPEKHNTSQEMEVLEGLRPSSNIKHLEVKFYMGSGFHPSWLHEDVLSSLASLSISSCPNITTLFGQPSRTDGSSSSSSSSTGILTGFRSLTKLSITWCKRLTGLDNVLHPECLPAIKVIRISNCEDLVSLPTKSLGEFVHLEDLEVSHCWSLDWEQGLTLPASLKVLKLEACGEFSDSALGCLRGLAALTSLDLQFCPSIESICTQIWSDLVSLQSLKIVCCQGLNSVGGSEPIARIENVDIRHCPKLKELQQPFRRGCYF